MADCADLDTHVIGQKHNFRADKNLTGTVTENQEVRRFMAGPPEHLRAKLSVPPGYRKRCNGPHGTTLSLFASAQSACARSSWPITFAGRVKIEQIMTFSRLEPVVHLIKNT